MHFLHVKAITLFNDGHLCGEKTTNLTEYIENFYELLTVMTQNNNRKIGVSHSLLQSHK
jgi:hypothetical protein